MTTAYACLTEIEGRAAVAVYHRREDAEAAAFGPVVAVNPLATFHAEALRQPTRIGVTYQQDQSWRDLRPLFGE